MTTQYAKDYDCSKDGHHWVEPGDRECDFCGELATDVADRLAWALENLREKAREYISHRHHGDDCGAYGHCGCGLKELEEALEEDDGS